MCSCVYMYIYVYTYEYINVCIFCGPVKLIHKINHHILHYKTGSLKTHKFFFFNEIFPLAG